MREYAVCAALLLLVSFTVSPLASCEFAAQTALEMVTVPIDYPTIREAIEVVVQGGTVFVKNGTYHERLTVKKAKRLVGESAEATIIGGGGTDVITVIADDVEIVNFTVQAFSEEGWVNLEDTDHGIVVDSASHCRIIGNRIMYSLYGIYLRQSSNITVDGNIIAKDFCGIHSGDSSSNVFRNNNITTCAFDFFYSRGLGIVGSERSHFVQDMDSSNTIDGKPICYWIDRQNEEVPRNAGYVALVGCGNVTVRDLEPEAIVLANSNGSVIVHNNMRNGSPGIWLFDCFDNEICENTLTNTTRGIVLDNSSYNEIYKNELEGDWGVNMVFPYCSSIALAASCCNSVYENSVSNSDCCISLGGSSNNNTVCKNSVKNADSSGISISDSVSNLVHENDITNSMLGLVLSNSAHNDVHNNSLTRNSDGIVAKDSSNNTISENRIEKNRDAGVTVLFSEVNEIRDNWIVNNMFGCGIDCSSHNTIRGNKVIGNSEFGVALWGSCYNELRWNDIRENGIGIHILASSYNSVRHNNLVGNTKQVEHVASSTNIWDDGYPSGGNFWSDYSGSDVYRGSYQNETGSDGIGDAPYVIDEGNRDYYPLMSHVDTLAAGTWEGIPQRVAVVSNSTISNFQIDALSHTLSFEIVGEEGSGHCRLTIPNAIAYSLWQEEITVLVDSEDPLAVEIWSDAENTYVYFVYHQSHHEIVIVPEFPLGALLPLLALAAIILFFRKKLRN